ncbi:hypothetical protein [Pseudothauera rhizosphaerae]|uniref:Uncharacterized protein n=1 Tax=Pseudothauera rhizosphaerae TaxID=2565932 RepID=A0A4S4AWR0_9RHOO|nr:hypothetical protein [Pseudothauera rhizosphaerae]THF64337.1 hypothetical protein E6O51_03230 [Pseudothauera rhizosphaerae]
MSLTDQLAACAARADIAERAAGMEQFRADFKSVWRWRRECGEISAAEFESSYAQASEAVREHAGDAEWMRCAMADYRQQALQRERDTERAERIRAAVRAENEAKRRKAA